MLVEKEVIRPGTYWYRDESTGQPRKLVVTPELTRHWHDQGNAMLSSGLTVPVPCEHDFDAHPMTPAEKLKSNAGWVKQYTLKGDALFSSVDVTDADVAKKLPHTIRWTSPWINSFTDGNGKEWKNVISHLALTTRPRIVDQQPFGSVAAALSMASESDVSVIPPTGIHLSRAGRLARSKQNNKLRPVYPIAFSLMTGVALGPDDMPPKAGKPKKGGNPFAKGGNGDGDDDDEGDDDFGGGDDDGIDGVDMDDDPTNDDTVDLPPMGSEMGDVSMVELLCDLLGALGIQVEHGGSEENFKRMLYNAAMTEIHNLTGKAKAGEEQQRTNPPGQPPNNPKQPAAGSNPLIQQEQQPMFMSLEDIKKLDEPLKSVALSMYNETQKANAKAAQAEKVLNSLRDGKLKEEETKRKSRVNLLGRLSPRVKADLDAMLAMPAMALSMGEGGAVVDPMATTLAVLEKGLADLPRLLTTDASALSVQAQPQDADMLTDARANEIADIMARQMGCPPLAGS